MKLVVIGSDGCLASGFIGLLDILWLAGRAINNGEKSKKHFQVISASVDGKPVVDGHGRRLDVDRALKSIATCDAILVPGYVPDENGRPPDLAALAPVATWIRRQHARGALVYASCSGVFLAGEAGLLDGRKCTTTWWLHDEMKQRFPRAEAAWASALVEDRRVVTAGGPLSWIDLALHVVRKLYGPESARIAADFAVVDIAPSSQAIYIPAGHLAAANLFLTEAERIVRMAGKMPLNARDLAERLSTSERTLHRRLQQISGESPKNFIDRIRFETAKTLLETGVESLKHVAANAGYSDDASFRRMFKRLSGMTPGAYRVWFRARRDHS